LLTYQQIAADGLTMAQAHSVPTSTLQPGYRYDALVVFPQAGDYCVVNESAPPAGSVSRQAASRNCSRRPGRAGPTIGNTKDFLQNLLANVATQTLAPNVRRPGRGRSSRRAEVLKLRPRIPILPTARSPESRSWCSSSISPIRVSPSRSATSRSIRSISIHRNSNRQPYDPNRIDRVLRLGGVDEWTLQSGFVKPSLPYPRQSVPDRVDHRSQRQGCQRPRRDRQYGGLDPQYPGLKGVWKDTLWIKDLINNPADFPSKLATSMYTIKVRTRYQRYIGEYVLHCHILDHEDPGHDAECRGPDSGRRRRRGREPSLIKLRHART